MRNTGTLAQLGFLNGGRGGVQAKRRGISSSGVVRVVEGGISSQLELGGD